MTIARLFVLRPVATSLLMVALVLVGLVAVRFLPISSLPDVEYPTLQVKTFYPGASPQVMATTVPARLDGKPAKSPTPPRLPAVSPTASSAITFHPNDPLNSDAAAP